MKFDLPTAVTMLSGTPGALDALLCDLPAGWTLGTEGPDRCSAFDVADGVGFFHMDALSSAVAMNVDCDLQLTLTASSLYRLPGTKIGIGYQVAESRHIFPDFVDVTAAAAITDNDITVRLQKRAHDPSLSAAGLTKAEVPIPRLGGKRLRFVFG